MLPETAAALAVLAALLAWPVPALLGRARWPGRDPLVALVGWQAVGLAGGLSILGALLAYGLAPWGQSLPGAGRALLTGSAAPAGAGHWAALALAAAVFRRLGAHPPGRRRARRGARVHRRNDLSARPL